MCLGVPMRVIEIKEPGKTALAEVQGVRREIVTMLLGEDPKVGDWVTVHIGYALDVLDTETAEEILYVLGLMGGEAPQKGSEASRNGGEPSRKGREAPQKEGEPPRKGGRPPRKERKSTQNGGQPPRAGGEPPRKEGGPE